jgi:diguanylate cyclase (GGDEF)-like protein/PAS domain S-box-containing protein
VLPIQIDGRFWGFIGFDDCHTDRVWSTTDKRILEATAAAIGGTFIRMAVESQLLTQQQRYRRAVRAGKVGVWTWDIDTGEMELDPQLKQMLGYEDHEIPNRLDDWAAHVHPDDRPAVAASIDRYLSGVTTEYHLEHRMIHRDGSIRWFEARGQLVGGSGEDARQIIGTDTDITERVQSKKQIEHLAYYDALTNLPNLSLLTQRASVVMAMTARRNEYLALLCLDLDDFKKVNESLGHDVGNELLRQTAKRLEGFVRNTDTLCRLSGDEFILLLPSVNHATALQITKRILSAFTEPFHIDGYPLHVTISIGIALSGDSGPGFNELLKNADGALHRAKRNGRNRLEFHDPGLHSSSIERLVLESDLRQAVRGGQLIPYFQPKLCLQTNRITGVEALVRWQHPERGIIPPGNFIPIAEESDLIVDIGENILDAVCEQLSRWREQGLALVPVAVNLAARHFQTPGFVAGISGRLQKMDLCASLLELEITESTLLNTNARVDAELSALERLGVGLAIDDFGTGYSSLSYIKKLPLTTLKIDRSFVRDIAVDEHDRALAATIVTLGRSLGVKVVAEGIETEAQLELLQNIHCDQGQGFLFCAPMASADFTEWLRTWQSIAFDAESASHRG